MALSIEAQSRIAHIREKVKSNTVTKEELREAIALMREDRVGAAAVSAKAKARKAKPDADAMLSELEGLE